MKVACVLDAVLSEGALARPTEGGLSSHVKPRTTTAFGPFPFSN